MASTTYSGYPAVAVTGSETSSSLSSRSRNEPASARTPSRPSGGSGISIKEPADRKAGSNRDTSALPANSSRRAAAAINNGPAARLSRNGNHAVVSSSHHCRSSSTRSVGWPTERIPRARPSKICACAKRRPSPGTQRWVRGAASRASRRSCPLLHQEGVDLPPPARSRRGWPAIGGCEDDATSQQPVLAPASVPSRNSVWWPRQRRRYVPSGRAQRSAGSCRRRHRPARPAIEPGR